VPYDVLASGSAELVDRFLRPALRDELHDAHAVTEEPAGSDPSGIRARARHGDGGWGIALLEDAQVRAGVA
jgi:acyl-CoA dehydrogenase